jgi:FtsP/CotA-like multicopper oxidase with cupredoxin domain
MNMTTQAKSRSAWIAGLASALALAVLVPHVVSSSFDDTREIHLVVRDMTYYIDGHDVPNPTLHVRRGERIRIRLTNRDLGMSHDFGVRAWQRGTGLIDGPGEAAVEFVAPRTPGEETYSCTPHGEMMRGTIRIE